MYGKDAIYYDALNAGLQAADLAFYQKLLKEKGGRICELACGTGRILLSLQDDSRELTGIDLSEEMLAIAEKKAEASGCAVRLICQDMCQLGQYGPYDVMICGYNSIQHICEEERFIGFLEGIRDNLDEKGIVCIDLFHSDSRFLFTEGNSRRLAEFAAADGGRIAVDEYTHYHPKTQINDIIYRYYRDGEFLFEESYCMKQYDAIYLDTMLWRYGFEILHKYGDYDFTPFSEASPKQIYILRRR